MASPANMSLLSSGGAWETPDALPTPHGLKPGSQPLELLKQGAERAKLLEEVRCFPSSAVRHARRRSSPPTREFDTPPLCTSTFTYGTRTFLIFSSLLLFNLSHSWSSSAHHELASPPPPLSLSLRRAPCS